MGPGCADALQVARIGLVQAYERGATSTDVVDLMLRTVRGRTFAPTPGDLGDAAEVIRLAEWPVGKLADEAVAAHAYERADRGPDAPRTALLHHVRHCVERARVQPVEVMETVASALTGGLNGPVERAAARDMLAAYADATATPPASTNNARILEQIAELHVCSEPEWSPSACCRECGSSWPCDTAKLVDA